VANTTSEEIGYVDELYGQAQSAFLNRSWFQKFSGTSEASLENIYQQFRNELLTDGWNPGTTQWLSDFIQAAKAIPMTIDPSLEARLYGTYEERRHEVGDTNVVDTVPAAAQDAIAFVKDKAGKTWDALGSALGWLKWIAIGGAVLAIAVVVFRIGSWIPKKGA
jgi:hypothetical protein